MLKLGEVLFRFRNYTPIPLVVLIAIFSSATRNSLIVGVLIMILGEVIRLVGVSHIGTVSRTRSYSTGQKLIVSGPFAHVRNPLYIGNFFLTGGLTVASNLTISGIQYSNWLFIGLYVVYFFGQYIPIVLWEESNLADKFGSAFKDYIKQVPRWIPSIRPKNEEEKGIKGDYKSAIKSERSTLSAAVVVLFIIIWRSFLF